MAIDRGILDKLRTRGEEVLTQLSAELTSNPRFMKAMESAMEKASRGREVLEQAAARALHEINVSTRGDLKRANSRIEALEREVAALRARARTASASRAAGPGRPTAARPGRARAKAGRGRPG
ncbi:MAG TPA: hypothetical protein VEQ10_04770 [Vicinamibacteria bacterium]|nr:hypothetical protein [Vicinamibacteria bacterium]